MSDKKLNSVSPVTDAAYVYAETSNGETVKISKADLASVVAEQQTATNLGYDYFSGHLKIAIDKLKNLSTGIHMIETGGPIYHAIVCKFTEVYYSAIITSYDGSNMLPLYVRYDGKYVIRTMT